MDLGGLPPELTASGVSAGRLAPGTRLGPYRIEGLLGQGGMGAVYAALHLDLQRPVALKTLLDPQAGEEERARFVAEARALAKIDHPNVVPLYDAGSWGPLCFLVMEHVRGESLAARLAASGGRLPVAEAVRIVGAVAEGVGAAHAQGILHRDVKPDNVLLGADGIPRLTDFGLARSEQDQRLTASGVALGTPHYMAPEQALGDHTHLGPPVDVYGLGAVLYECLCGQRPYAEEQTALAVLSATVERGPRPPRELLPSLPRDLEAVLLRALARDPNERYPDAAALAEELACFARGEPVAARLPGLASRALRAVRREGRTIGLSVALTLALCASLALAAVPLLRARSLAGLETRAASWRAAELARLGAGLPAQPQPADAAELRERLGALEPARLEAAAQAALTVGESPERARALRRGLGDPAELRAASAELEARLLFALGQAEAAGPARWSAWARAWVRDPASLAGRSAAQGLLEALAQDDDPLAQRLAAEAAAELVAGADEPAGRARGLAARFAAEALDLRRAAALTGESSLLGRLARSLAKRAPAPAGEVVGFSGGQLLTRERARLRLHAWSEEGPGALRLERPCEGDLVSASVAPLWLPERPDLLVLRRLGGELVWESFELASVDPSPTRVWRGKGPKGLRAAVWGDLDGDRRADLVLVGGEGLAQSFALLGADPKPVPLFSDFQLPAWVVGRALCADLDGDGRDEVVLGPNDLHPAQPAAIEVLALAQGRFRARASVQTGPLSALEVVRREGRDELLAVVDVSANSRGAEVKATAGPAWLGRDGCYRIRDGGQGPAVVGRWTYGPDEAPTSASRFHSREVQAWPWRLGDELYLARARLRADERWEWEWAAWDGLALERNPEPALRLLAGSRPSLSAHALDEGGRRALRLGEEFLLPEAVPAQAGGEAPRPPRPPDRLARAVRWLTQLGASEAAAELRGVLQREHPDAAATRELALAEVDALLERAEGSRGLALRCFAAGQAAEGRQLLERAQELYLRAGERGESLARGREGWEPPASESWPRAAAAWRGAGAFAEAERAASAALARPDLPVHRREGLRSALRQLQARTRAKRVEIGPKDLERVGLRHPLGVSGREGALRLPLSGGVEDGLFVPIQLEPGACAIEADLVLEGSAWCARLRVGLFAADGRGRPGVFHGLNVDLWSVHTLRPHVYALLTSQHAREESWPTFHGPLRLRLELEPTALGGTRARWWGRDGSGQLTLLGEQELARPLAPHGTRGGEELWLGFSLPAYAGEAARIDQSGFPMRSSIRLARLAAEGRRARLGWGQEGERREQLRLWRAHAQLALGDPAAALRAYQELRGEGSAAAATRQEARWWGGFARHRQGDSQAAADLVAVAEQAPDLALRWLEDVAERCPPQSANWTLAAQALARLRRHRDPLLVALANSLSGVALPLDPAWGQGSAARRRALLHLQARWPNPEQGAARATLRELKGRPPRHRLPAVLALAAPQGLPPWQARYVSLRGALARSPNDPRPLLSMARFLAESRMLGPATTYAEQAFALAKDEPTRNQARVYSILHALSLRIRARALDLLRAYRASGGDPAPFAPYRQRFADDAELTELLRK